MSKFKSISNVKVSNAKQQEERIENFFNSLLEFDIWASFVI